MKPNEGSNLSAGGKMRVLDMSAYRLYRPMGQSCLTRPIREKRVRWIKPAPEKVLQGRFMVRPLSRPDIEAAAELWRQAYPEVYGSSHDFLLYPEEYQSRLALVETWERDALDKPGCMLLAEEVATSRLAAATLMTKFDKNLQIEYTFAGTHPDYRRKGLMGALGSVMHRMVRASGAEYLTTFLETWHTITQAETLKLGRGWKIAGIFPGNFTRWAGGQQEYRACEVHMYQFVNEGEKYATRPEEWQLHPDLKPLWELLEAINARLGQKS
jgi:GNAT superfamily N-acetyltransferase